MAAWIILILVGLSSAVPPYRSPIPKTLLPPPVWNPNHQQTQQHNIPPFQRGAVESPPTTIGRLSNDLDYDEFGSRRYPLRDAVEALPVGATIAESSQTLSDSQR